MSDPAVSAERAFVSREAEHIDEAARTLRRAVFLSPGAERSEIVASVVAQLEQAAEALRPRV